MKKIIGILFGVIVISILCTTGAYAKKMYVATVDSMLGMYLSPDKDSLKITDIPGSAEIDIVKSEGTWGNAIFANKCGWINMSFVRNSYEEAAGATGVETLKNVETCSGKNKVNLYTLPSYEEKYGSVKKYSVPDGIILRITRETQDGWGLVCVNDKYLWVNLRDTKPYITETEQAIVDYELYSVYTFSETGNGVKLYSDPTGKGVLATVVDCVKLTVRETKNNYAYVSYNGINGWINLDNTTKSYSNAQTKTGKEINAEYEITGEIASSVDIFNVPSNRIKDGAVAIGSINSGTKIFVQRCTADGWLLVNHNGNIGWIPPDHAILQPNDDLLLIKHFDKKKEGFVATGMENGLPIYSRYDSNSVVARIPACVKVEILAEKDGRQYVYCDYASGWTEPEGLAVSYKEATEEIYMNKPTIYILEKDADFMRLPMKELLCGNENLFSVKKGTEMKITSIVTTGKMKWGLTEINGKKGWVNIDETRKMNNASGSFLVFVIIMCVMIIATVAIFAVYKIKTRKKNLIIK